jgi:hypothetical protein
MTWHEYLYCEAVADENVTVDSGLIHTTMVAEDSVTMRDALHDGNDVCRVCLQGGAFETPDGVLRRLAEVV